MTEKRFYRNRGTIWENDKSMSLGEVEDKLNALYEDNEQLKNLIKTLIKEVEKRRITVNISNEYKELLG